MVPGEPFVRAVTSQRNRARKERIRAHYDEWADRTPAWRGRRAAYYEEIDRFVDRLVPPGASVLDAGCGTGELLGRLRRPRMLGIDFSPRQIDLARARHPNAAFETADLEDPEAMEDLAARYGTYDWIVLSNVVDEVDDVWQVFRNLRAFCHPGTRLLVFHFNYLWEPAVRVTSALGLHRPITTLNWLSRGDMRNLLVLNGFVPITEGHRCILPFRIPLLAPLANRFLVELPVLRNGGLAQYVLARPIEVDGRRSVPQYAVSVVCPCRNERGNVRAVVERLPHMGSHTELIFVDGESDDGTVEEIQKVIQEEKGRRDIRLIHQRPNKGKGDAVRLGFAAARGEVLMILDADLTAAPEDLPKFYLALVENRCEFVNGSRFVYPMERAAMRFLNFLGNKFFAVAFTWLLGRPLRDTLCGTKVLFKKDWERIVAGRAYFGDFDPFGDFDLLFGATRLGLEIREIPVRYSERKYGSTKISRFRHGALLLRMCWVALWKLKVR